MKGYNKVILMGNVTRDPEVSYSNDLAIANFALAVNEVQGKNPDGSPKEVVTFVNVVFFGKMAEVIEKYVKRGSGLFVEGRLSISAYEKDGKKMYSTKVIGNTFMFVGGNGNQQDNGTQAPVQQSYQAKQPSQPQYQNARSQAPVQQNYNQNPRGYGQAPARNGNQYPVEQMPLDVADMPF